MYKYYNPGRAVAKNVTKRNMIIDHGDASVDNHMPEGYIFTVALSGMLYLFYHTKLLHLVLLLHKACDNFYCRPREIVHVYSYFMPVCGIVKATVQGAVDSSMHNCPRAEAEGYSTSNCHGTEGSSFDYSTKTAME